MVSDHDKCPQSFSFCTLKSSLTPPVNIWCLVRLLLLWKVTAASQRHHIFSHSPRHFVSLWWADKFQSNALLICIWAWPHVAPLKKQSSASGMWGKCFWSVRQVSRSASVWLQVVVECLDRVCWDMVQHVGNFDRTWRLTEILVMENFASKIHNGFCPYLEPTPDCYCML